LIIFIVTSIFLFQALLKQSGATEIESTDVGGSGHPGGAIDTEIAKIVDETLTDPEGPTTIEGGTSQSVEATA
jgi:hypothetical protein